MKLKTIVDFRINLLEVLGVLGLKRRFMVRVYQV